MVDEADEVGLPWYYAAYDWALDDVRDVTCDVALLKFIMHWVLPEGLYEAGRVEHADRFLHWRDGKLNIGLEQVQAIDVTPLRLHDLIITAHS